MDDLAIKRPCEFGDEARRLLALLGTQEAKARYVDAMIDGYFDAFGHAPSPSQLVGHLSFRIDGAEEPCEKAMRLEAAEAGMYEYNGVKYPRLQLLTVEDIIERKMEFSMPNKVRSRFDTAQSTLNI